MAATDLLHVLTAGPATRVELQARLGVSQPTVSRLVARHADEVVAIGRARATRYARRRQLPGLAAELPVYRVDRSGEAHEIGSLTTVHGGVAFHDLERGVGDVHAGLPWFLADMRPQGFIGRAFVRRFPELDLPRRLSDWSDDHALVALSRRGEDAVGNLIVGEESFIRWTQTVSVTPVPQSQRGRRYPRLAEQALGGELAGSSAGGEQPKFTARVDDGDDARHVLVKFSDRVDTPAGRRWADLLVCEHLALQAVIAAGMPAARSTLLEAGGRMFLELERFDRVGPRGRLGLVSLAALDDEFIGQRRDWTATARELVRLRRLPREDAERIAWLQAFGTCIGNTDMHFGNVSLLHEGRERLELAPAYDMLPMRYAPVAGGEVRTPPWIAPSPPPLALAQWRSARSAAAGFWQAVAADRRVSAGFRRIAQGCAQACR